jgi:DNA-binding transcriptional LysR family regulator
MRWRMHAMHWCMNQETPSGNWEDLRLFLAVLRAGTLTRAAQVLGVDQSTVSRRLEAFTRRTGTALVERQGRRWVATDAGREAQARAEAAERELLGFFREVDGVDRRAEGTVRLTAPEGLGLAVFAPRLPAFRAAHPGVRLLLSAESPVLDLARREADVAVRFVRPVQRELRVRRLCTIPFHAWASRAYLEARPRRGLAVAEEDDRVALHEQASAGPEVAWARERPSQVRVQVRSPFALGAAVAAGAGVGVLAPYLGRFFGLQRLSGGPQLERDLFLVLHRSQRASARVRAVVAWVEECLGRL